MLGEGIEQFADSEVIDSRTEEDRCQTALLIGLFVEGMARTDDKFELLAQFVGLVAQDLIQPWVV